MTYGLDPTRPRYPDFSLTKIVSSNRQVGGRRPRIFYAITPPSYAIVPNIRQNLHPAPITHEGLYITSPDVMSSYSIFYEYKGGLVLSIDPPLDIIYTPVL